MKNACFLLLLIASLQLPSLTAMQTPEETGDTYTEWLTIHVLAHTEQNCPPERTAIKALRLRAAMMIAKEPHLDQAGKLNLINTTHIQTTADFETFKKNFTQEIKSAMKREAEIRRNAEKRILLESIILAIESKDVSFFRSILAYGNQELLYKIFTEFLQRAPFAGNKLFSHLAVIAFDCGSPEIGQLIQEFIASYPSRLYRPLPM